MDTISRELKLRILNEMPEVVRISVDMRQCVALLRSDCYVGTQQVKEQDCQFIIVQPATQLWRFTLSNLFDQMSEYMTHQFGLHVHFSDLASELPDLEHVMIQNTLLDLMFICLASSQKTEIFTDGMRVCRVMLFYRPNIEPLQEDGERHLSY